MSNNNLNAYINGSKLELGESSVKPKMIEELISLLPEIDEKYIDRIANAKEEYAESSKFFEWLSICAKNIKDTFNRTKPLCDIGIEEFEGLVEYVMQNIILHNVGIGEAAAEKEDNPVYSVSNISVLSSIINRYFENIFYDGASKFIANKSIQRNTGISEEKCDIFWKNYLKEEQALWRKYSMRLQVDIGKRLNDLLEALFNIEEE